VGNDSESLQVNRMDSRAISLARNETHLRKGVSNMTHPAISTEELSYRKRRGWTMFPGIERVYVNERARKDLGWRPKYDFRYVLDRLRAGDDPGSPLSRLSGQRDTTPGPFQKGLIPWVDSGLPALN
jgi:UDP-glucose 4-epimerase